jgi:hypothetical protein
MDIFEILIRDHKKVSEIFHQLGSTNDQTVREMLFLQLKEELEIHTQIEKSIFHPALMNRNGSSRVLDKSEEYFENIRDLLSELEDIPTEDRLWKRKLFELKLNFQNHVDEEDEVFSDARHLLSRAEIEEMGMRAEEIKEWL